MKRPLDALARSKDEVTCPDGFIGVVDEIRGGAAVPPRLIPKIVHQTSRSRCLTPRLAQLTDAWRLPGHDYYFHDDRAVDRLLLEKEWPMFPHLAMVAGCLTQGTIKADLWRYLVLYEYGGIYADIDTKPAAFDGSQITDDTDAFFEVEDYHLLSQYFMAASPRHPILYYAVHNALLNLLGAEDSGSINAAFQTGPHALHKGFQAFMADAGREISDFRPGAFPVAAGVYVGTDRRSATVVGQAERRDEFVVREAIRREQKTREYARMGMTHFLDDAKGSTGTSYLRAVYAAHKKEGMLD
ncbi:MAG: glycosyltransferase [Acidobacteriota bacterium]